jgi:hypothetical protein
MQAKTRQSKPLQSAGRFNPQASSTADLEKIVLWFKHINFYRSHRRRVCVF